MKPLACPPRASSPAPRPPAWAALDAGSARERRPRQGPDRHHARPGDEPQLPDLGGHALGLREGQPQRRDQEVRRRGVPARQGGTAACCTSSPSAASSSRRTSTGSRTSPQAGHPIGNHTYDHVNVLATKPEDIQFRFQPRAVADRGQDAGRGDPREHPPDRRAPSKARVGIDAGRLPHAGRLRQRPGRPARRAADAAGPGLHLGQQQVPGAPDRRARQGADGRRCSTSIVAAQAAAQPFVYPSGPDRSADEPDQRHRRLPQRPLEARVVPEGRSASAWSGPSRTGRSSTSSATRRACMSPTPSSRPST